MSDESTKPNAPDGRAERGATWFHFTKSCTALTGGLFAVALVGALLQPGETMKVIQWGALELMLLALLARVWIVVWFFMRAQLASLLFETLAGSAFIAAFIFVEHAFAGPA